MTESTSASPQAPAIASRGGKLSAALINRVTDGLSRTSTPFEVVFPDASRRQFGRDTPRFSVILKNAEAVRAFASMDEGRIGDAFVDGHFDIQGDMLEPFRLRNGMADRHLLLTAWRFVEPLLFGQVRTNKRAIASHYDIDSEFFLSFLDPVHPLYTQGIYLAPDETLATASRRKLDYCFDKLGLKAGDRILEIGPGWGAWFEYASARGVKCTGLTISQESLDYLTRRAGQLSQDWTLINCDFLDYKTEDKYDAIVIMGVIEHLPNYRAVLDKFASLLKPGGRVFLDGSACIKKYELSSFMVKHIYGGNHSFLVLHDFLTQMAQTPLRVSEMHDDRMSYFLTFKQWATNFDAHRQSVIDRFGERNFRRFRLYLWGAAYEFLSGSLDCYRMIIELPTYEK